jgi:hypothetical protein
MATGAVIVMDRSKAPFSQWRLNNDGCWRRRLPRHDQRRDDRALEQRNLLYILRVRERTELLRDVVLHDAGSFVPLLSRSAAETPTIVPKRSLPARCATSCINHQEAAMGAADRTAILAALERQLRSSDETLVGNTGFRRSFKTVGDDHSRSIAARLTKTPDSTAGSCCAPTPISTPTCHSPRQATLDRRGDLRATRPIFHKLDGTIRGHVFCSFPALVLKAELEARIAALGQN